MEVDVDCISDGEITVIGGIMEHIEQAGIHSGDSACVIPTFSLSKKVLAQISSATKAMAREFAIRVAERRCRLGWRCLRTRGAWTTARVANDKQT